MAGRRVVQLSPDFVLKAKKRYPPGGSVDGRPRYELFRDTILKSAIFEFSHNFDGLPYAIEGVAIKAVITVEVPFFPATVFYGVLRDDGVIEIIDFEPDDDYFRLLDTDPDD
jgi:hypothetical protein